MNFCGIHSGGRRLLLALFLASAAFITVPSAFAAQTTPPDREGMRARLAACATCHGEHGEGDNLGGGGVYPRLAGQHEGYLYKQLSNIKSAQRTGIPPVKLMHRLLESLPEPYLKLIAEYYGSSSPPYPASVPADAEQLKQGRELVLNGVPQTGIQPCTACHGADLKGRAPDTPSLAGQYASYLTIQFEHWAQGARHDIVHEHIAKSLSMPQIKAMSEYLASLRPAGESTPSKPAASTSAVADALASRDGTR